MHNCIRFYTWIGTHMGVSDNRRVIMFHGAEVANVWEWPVVSVWFLWVTSMGCGVLGLLSLVVRGRLRASGTESLPLLPRPQGWTLPGKRTGPHCCAIPGVQRWWRGGATSRQSTWGTFRKYGENKVSALWRLKKRVIGNNWQQTPNKQTSPAVYTL